METRTRKLAPQYHRQEWRNKPAGNSASQRHSRAFILKNYKNLMQPQFQSKDSLDDIILDTPSAPLLTAIFPFAHSLGDEVNSRKHVVREKRPEQIPEWYEDEEPKENTMKPKVEEDASAEKSIQEVKPFTSGKGIKDIEEKDIEEKFTKIDLEVEEKLKKACNDEEDELPDWDEPDKEEFTFEPIKPIRPAGPVFDMNLLRYHFAIGNPFAETLIDFGVPAGKNSLTYNPESKPYEKIWFYKDLENNIHGPFSTLEMFAWTIHDCFPADLQIAIGSAKFFIPMNVFNSMTRIEEPAPPIKPKEPRTLQEIESLQSSLAGKSSNPTPSDYRKPTKSNESATLELKNILGLITKN